MSTLGLVTLLSSGAWAQSDIDTLGDPVASPPSAGDVYTPPAASIPEPSVVEPLLEPEIAPVAPIDAPTVVDSPSLGASEPYIDTTSYSLGATQRSSDLPQPTVAQRSPAWGAPATVQVGPLSVSSYGLGVGQTTASARDFYRRTLRPPGRLGNGNIRLIFPLSIPAPITSLFGWRVHPISGEQRFHSGTDLGAPLGTPVLAAYAGRVAIADLLGGYGLTVTLQHNKATQETLYAHLSEIFVKPGEWVNQGTVIGRVGSTGLSTGPHLHFEFRQLTPDGWVVMDPGAQLEYALAELVKSMQVAQAKPKNQ